MTRRTEANEAEAGQADHVRVVMDLDVGRASITVPGFVRWMLKLAGRSFGIKCTSVKWADPEDVKMIGKEMQTK